MGIVAVSFLLPSTVKRKEAWQFKLQAKRQYHYLEDIMDQLGVSILSLLIRRVAPVVSVLADANDHASCPSLSELAEANSVLLCTRWMPH